MITPQHDTWLAEMKKADARLRAFTDGNGRQHMQKPRAAAMRWAIALSHEELDSLSEGDIANRQRELACLYRFEMKEPFLPHISGLAPWPSREVLGQTQHWLQPVLQSVISRTGLTYRAPERIWYFTWLKEDLRWSQTYSEKSREGTYTVNVLFDLVREHLDDILTCRREDCRNVFLRDRTNQQFCSTRCQWVDGQRKAQHVSPDRYGKRGRPAAIAKPGKKGSRKTIGGTRHGTKKKGYQKD